MREHAEQPKTVTSKVAIDDANKNAAHEIMTLKKERVRKDERQNTPNQKIQPKEGRRGGSEAAAWEAREEKGQIIYSSNLIAWTIAWNPEKPVSVMPQARSNEGKVIQLTGQGQKHKEKKAAKVIRQQSTEWRDN